MVKGATEEDGTGEPEDAQFGDFEEAGGWMEAADWVGEEALYWRSEEIEVSDDEGCVWGSGCFGGCMSVVISGWLSRVNKWIGTWRLGNLFIEILDE